MNKKLIYGAFAFAALGFASCSSDEPVNGGVAQKDEVRYLRVNLMNPKATRAAEFDEGTAAENFVEDNQIVMYFYDAAGNFITKTNPSDVSFVKNEGNPAPNVGEIGTSIVAVTISKSQNLPAYVMCYLNPVEAGAGGEGHMTSLRTVQRPSYHNGNDHFAMNNACYYGSDPISGGSNVFISSTPIAEGALFNSYEDAANALEEEDATKIVNIYVERYAAKVNFSINEGITNTVSGNTVLPDNTVRPYTLTYTPESWAINAASPTMFAIKNFANTEYTAPIPTRQAVQTYLGNWTTWNDASNNRSYWACSPSFFATSFPQVSDNIVDMQTVEGATGAGVVNGDYALRYFSYNQIAGIDNTLDYFHQSNGFTADDVLYTLENTMGKDAYASLNPKAAAPSVLMVGNYTVNYNGQAIPAGTDFYIFGQDELFFKNKVAGIDDPLMIDEFISRQQVLYLKNGDNYVLLTEANAPEGFLDLLTVEHPSADVRGDNLVPQRYVALQLTGIDGYDQVYFKANGNNTPIKITSENINNVNVLLWQQIGVAECFTKGKAFFSIPIWHLGMTENTVDRPFIPNTDGTLSTKIDWKKLRIGDMGLVRNHSYKLDVTKMTGRGTGIENLDYPIVPQMDEDEYNIAYRINVLNWRIVPTQNVEL